jgi:hypothetical protein
MPPPLSTELWDYFAESPKKSAISARILSPARQTDRFSEAGQVCFAGAARGKVSYFLM